MYEPNGNNPDTAVNISHIFEGISTLEIEFKSRRAKIVLITYSNIIAPADPAPPRGLTRRYTVRLRTE